MKKSYMYIDPSPNIVEYVVPQYDPLYYLYLPQNEERPEKKTLLNESAIFIIKQFNGKKTYSDILSILLEEYGGVREDIENELNNFINLLQNNYEYKFKLQEHPVDRTINVVTHHNMYPGAASLELTDRCNMRCRHCYGNYSNINSNDIPLDKVYSTLESLKEVGVHVIEITGGDPSVYSNVDLVINKINELKFGAIMFLTNGLFLPDTLLDAMEKVKDKLFVQVDLHSLNEEYFNWFTKTKGSLDSVKKNIDRLVSRKIRVRIAAIITPGNLNEMVKIADWANDHKALLFTPSVVTQMGRANHENTNDLFIHTEEDINLFNKQRLLIKEKYPKMILEAPAARINCGAITSEVSIDTQGNIKLCNMDDRSFLQLQMGNVFKSSIKDIYDENSEFIKAIKNVVLPKFESETCKLCSEKFFCSHCLIRGLKSAYRIKEKCKWYESLDPIITENLKFIEKIEG